MTVPSGFEEVMEMESTNSMSMLRSDSADATTSCAFSGVKITICVAYGARLKFVELLVTKQAPLLTTLRTIGGSQGVGDREGFTVGESVGEGVGPGVGPVVGEVVGRYVGLEEVGSFVGDSVGRGVGLVVVGRLVGPGVGSVVGLDVGLVVGR